MSFVEEILLQSKSSDWFPIALSLRQECHYIKNVIIPKVLVCGLLCVMSVLCVCR